MSRVTMSLTAVISYCTNDRRFIGRCIQEAKEFADHVLVVVCDHFFNGQPENRDALEATYAENEGVEFLEFAYDPKKLYSPYHRVGPKDLEWAIFWAATTRYIGYYFAPKETEWFFFLDSDEIAEGKKVKQWLEEKEQWNGARFACYQYGLNATTRAKEVMGYSLLVRKGAIGPLSCFNELERLGMYGAITGPKKDFVLEDAPIFHHYSWVRTKEECLQKVRTWGHRHDKDWEEAVERAFGGELSELFFQPYRFEQVTPYFDPLQWKEGKGRKKTVKKIGMKELRMRELEEL